MSAETKSATRCGFEDMAKRINEHHRLAREQAESAIEHAFRVGELLIEAKAKAPHGKWLPWLRENVEFSERSAQAYMRLASSHKAIKTHIADDEDGISVRKALGYLRRPLRTEYQAEDSQNKTEADSAELQNLKDIFGDDVLALGKHLLDRPFCAYDTQGDNWYQHFKNKLLHQSKVEGAVGAMLHMMPDYDPIPLLRLVPAHELCDALEKLWPWAANKAALPIETRTIAHAKIIIGAAECIAGYCCGAILCEFDHRETLDDETYAAEFEDVRRRFVATTDARLDAIRDVQARHERGEYETIEQYAAAFDAANQIEAAA